MPKNDYEYEDVERDELDYVGIDLKVPPTEPEILVVDDDANVRTLLVTMIQREKYRCDTAGSIGEARQMLARKAYDIVFLDLQLPDGSGVDILQERLNFSPNTVVAIVSGEQELETAVRVMREGAYDFISKPFAVGTFTERLAKVVDEWRSRTRFEYYRHHLEELVDAMTDRLMTSFQEIDRIRDMTVEALGAAIDLRDPETEEHCRRVAEQGVLLGRAHGMTAAELRNLWRGSYLHDIGKIGVPESILSKPGALNEQELELVRLHPILGFRLISKIDFLRGSTDVILYHHERFDGRGYPHGLRGKQIPLPARIFAVVDTMDAMLNDRSYRKALPFRDLVEELRDNSGTQFDPDVIERFLSIPEAKWHETNTAISTTQVEKRLVGTIKYLTRTSKDK